MKPVPTPVSECGGTHAPQALSINQARARLENEVKAVGGVEQVPLRGALGRILAEDVYSSIDVPPHTNSAMDGYAVRASDLSTTGTASLRIIGSASAGTPYHGGVGPGECVRIMTGAPLPTGADTVIMQEQVQREADGIRVGAGHAHGENVRYAGEDLAQGQLVLAAGRQALPADLGLLASLGLAEVSVKRRLRVAFFTTGDELRSVGETLGPGQIYDSNRYTLYGMLCRLGVDFNDMGVVRDERAAIERALIDACTHADAIITSGGVSVGTHDYVKETLAALGDIHFWQVAMKPGRPLAFGRVHDATFFGLPGNPVSVMATFYQFVEPALRKMMGNREFKPIPTFRVPCAVALHKRPGRVEFQRGILERAAGGDLVVRATGNQSSGVLQSMSRANCFIVLPSDAERISAGTPVEVQPFFGMI